MTVATVVMVLGTHDYIIVRDTKGNMVYNGKYYKTPDNVWNMEVEDGFHVYDSSRPTAITVKEVK